MDKSVVSSSPTPTLVSDRSEQRQLRLRQFLSREDALEQICDNIANGGSVPSIAKVLDVYPGHITRWLRFDPERSRRFEAALADRDEWEKEQILHQLRAIGNFDIRCLFDKYGNLKSVDEWPDDAAVAVSGIDVTEGDDVSTKKIKLIDRIKALEMSGKAMSMFQEKIHHTGELTLEQLVFGADDVDSIQSDSVESDDFGDSH
jgi:hypothetical protein